MQERFNTFLKEDPEGRISGYLARVIQDPLKPLTTSGRPCVNPLLLILTAITLFAGGVFLFFAFAES